mmetsp:Transcript_42738/g.80161  ORF Transcript_42738/g.80161 Transcript_42738/m.80161 type:complete len:238 (-) Transcript_42738:25-738(-)
MPLRRLPLPSTLLLLVPSWPHSGQQERLEHQNQLKGVLLHAPYPRQHRSPPQLSEKDPVSALRKARLAKGLQRLNHRAAASQPSPCELLTPPPAVLRGLVVVPSFCLPLLLLQAPALLTFSLHPILVLLLECARCRLPHAHPPELELMNCTLCPSPRPAPPAFSHLPCPNHTLSVFAKKNNRPDCPYAFQSRPIVVRVPGHQRHFCTDAFLSSQLHWTEPATCRWTQRWMKTLLQQA